MQAKTATNGFLYNYYEKLLNDTAVLEKIGAKVWYKMCAGGNSRLSKGFNTTGDVSSPYPYRR